VVGVGAQALGEALREEFVLVATHPESDRPRWRLPFALATPHEESGAHIEVRRVAARYK
jgi:hypothetical protein